MATPLRYRAAAPADTPRSPGDPAAAACLSLVTRVQVPVETALLRRNLHEAAARFSVPGRLWLWEDVLPVGSTDPAASARVEREARRSVHSAGFPVRAVLLRYTDGEADLVLVALRSVLSGRAVRDMATAVLEGGEGVSATSQPAAAGHSVTDKGVRAGSPGPKREWGLGDPARAGHTGETPLELPAGLRASDAVLVGAVGLVVARYESVGTATVGVLDPDGAGDVVRVYRGTADESRSVSEYLRQWQDPRDDEPFTTPLPEGFGYPLPTVGVVLGQFSPQTRHRLFLAPTLPIILHWERWQNGGVHGVLLYDKGEVAPWAARNFATHVMSVAHQLADAPDRDLATVELMTEVGTQEVLRAGTTPPTGALPRRTAHTIDAMFAEVVRQRGSAIALTAGDTELTYEQLDSDAALIAAGLRELGLEPGSRVGVALERNADLVVALLAVLKAGGAYVPMDLRYPQDRLRYTVEDAGAAVVIGDPAIVPALEGARVTAPEELRSLGGDRSAGTDEQLSRPGDGDAPAYVIYTSGSTGRPKGVVVPHRNVGALIDATREDFGLGESDVWTLFHSSAFDFSVWEMWGCLLTGGRVVVVPYWATRDTELFHELLAEQRVTVLSQTPSAFAQLVETDRQGSRELAVRLVVFGGEALNVAILAPWFARYSHTRCRLVNMFGITETTVHVTAHTVTPADVVAGSKSVGRALPGWSLSVRDRQGRVLPPGVPGEICVGGAGVAECYLGRPELTAERFIADPHGVGRIYRSGDLGRLSPDGRLDHLGRLDNQVKVRGHRIELDEIRNVLLGHPEVLAAAAALNHETPGDAATARIDGYVVLRGAGPTAEVLAHARGILPDYMVPVSVIAVPSLPLTINGKLDTAALSAFAAATPAREAGRAGDVTPAEGGSWDTVAEEVMKLWSHILNTDVGPEDNFFELGGNSLLVLRVLREMKNQGLPRVSTQDFYRNSTASHFVALVQGQQDGSGG